MCYICDGKRDLRVMAAAMSLMASIDFDRGRMVLMASKVHAERIREIIEEQGPDEHGGVFLNLSSLLPEEDEDTASIKAAMAISMLLEDTLEKLDVVFHTYGPFVVPAIGHETEPADAFSEFIGTMFGVGGEHDEEDDEEEQV